jgi:hypothetical protein
MKNFNNPINAELAEKRAIPVISVLLPISAVDHKFLELQKFKLSPRYSF